MRQRDSWTHHWTFRRIDITSNTKMFPEFSHYPVDKSKGHKREESKYQKDYHFFLFRLIPSIVFHVKLSKAAKHEKGHHKSNNHHRMLYNSIAILSSRTIRIHYWRIWTWRRAGHCVGFNVIVHFCNWVDCLILKWFFNLEVLYCFSLEHHRSSLMWKRNW